MAKVTLDFFKESVMFNASAISFNKSYKDGMETLEIGPEDNRQYRFEGVIPDVLFKGFEIKEVYFQPYRTFIRLKETTRIKVSTDGRSKLFVEKAQES